MMASAKTLNGAGRHVEPEPMPAHVADDDDDADAYLHAPFEDDGLEEREEEDDDDDADSIGSGSDEDPIEVGADERAIADAAIARLANEANLYHRGGRLVRVTRDSVSDKVLLRPPTVSRISELTRANLRETLSEHVHFVGGGKYPRPVPPPTPIVQAIMDRGGDWPELRRLRAVENAPVLRADGTITERAGYDEATELLVLPSSKFPPMPKRPTPADAVRARDVLLEVVVDFPFASEIHRAAWLTALLTTFARHAYDGPAPLTAIDKNTRGAGGTLLADAIGMIATGASLPRMVAAKDAEEERKRITAIARSGDPIVLIDNVAGQLGTDALDAALTSTTWSDRLLGTNTHATYPLHVTWIATGNNIEFGADTLRRTMHVRLESPEERPEERTGFRHPDLLAWVKAERPRLVVAALTMLRAYHLAGRPDVGLVPWGSYEEWSSLVRGAVVWSGMPDPGRTRQELAEGDGEANALGDLLVGWRDAFGDRGATVAAALKMLEAPAHAVGSKRDALKRIRASLAELCPTPKADTLPTPRALGNRLKKARGRVIGGLALDTRGKGSAGVPLFVREATGASDSSDSSDSVSTPNVRERGSNQRETESPASPESLPVPKLRRRSEVILRRSKVRS